MPISPYITGLRAHIGHDLLLLPGASAVVRDDQGRILLLKRSDNGQWSLPAGMIDPGEQPAETVLREIEEETGVIAEIERLAGVAMHAAEYPNGDKCEYLAVWFRCRAVGGQARPDGDESLEVGWFTPDDMPEVSGLTKLRIETTAAPDGPPWFVQPGDVHAELGPRHGL
ncbi:NUDIX domain-containing protein [Actinoplanes sp. LDG1-06]|uniref:NUDIX domain-containing protein n=1 Tax=Paractinoplanes ovalisporus TaxID=2810368 RepID=A0ABS2A8G7_9ACTN|nr:NUDIX domain-containing protein [Actinoplanes ovalisporus]MBM2616143.1 NUDIX domain-containing protein [Actinoplanes ovalisporus]